MDWQLREKMSKNITSVTSCRRFMWIAPWNDDLFTGPENSSEEKPFPNINACILIAIHRSGEPVMFCHRIIYAVLYTFRLGRPLR